jgi:pilus assembly protein Flp/PilA
VKYDIVIRSSRHLCSIWQNWHYHAGMNMVSFQSKVLGWLPGPKDEESGQGMVEYAFILVLIALVVIVMLVVLGNQVANMWTNITRGVSGA